MKKVIFLTMIFSLLVVYAPKSYSGTAKDIIKTSAILTGIIGAASIAALATPLSYSHSTYYSSDHKYQDDYTSYRKSDSGYYKTVYEEVWISGYYKSIWVEPEFEFRWYQGRHIKVQIQDGYYKEIYIPGHYETVKRRYWVNDYRNKKRYKNKSCNSYPSKSKFPTFYSKYQY